MDKTSTATTANARTGKDSTMTLTKALISAPTADGIAIATITEQPKSGALEFSISQIATRQDERGPFSLSDAELDALEASMVWLHGQRSTGACGFTLDAEHGSLVAEVVKS